MNDQLDFGFPRPLGAETVAKVHPKESDSFSKRRSYPAETSPREREIYSRFLSWQDQYAYEVGIPREGPI